MNTLQCKNREDEKKGEEKKTTINESFIRMKFFDRKENTENSWRNNRISYQKNDNKPISKLQFHITK